MIVTKLERNIWIVLMILTTVADAILQLQQTLHIPAGVVNAITIILGSFRLIQNQLYQQKIKKQNISIDSKK